MLLKAFVRSLAVALVVLSSTTYAATIYVSTTGSDTNNGLSWSAARKTVQAGLNAAASGDQVWVAAGTYTQCITLKAGVALYGGFTGSETDLSQRNWTRNITTLDGGQSGVVVTASSGVDSTARIDGFAIQNSSSSTSSSGVNCSNASPTIANNTIAANGSDGVYCYNSSSTIANNAIIGNHGSGIAGSAASLTITNNTITGNRGCGIYCYNSCMTIANNTLASNLASGVYCDTSASSMIVNNTITGSGDGGVDCADSSPTITNTILAFNSVGVSADVSSAPSLLHNCVYGNSDYDYFGLIDPTGTDGNISADPNLVGVAYGNLHIQPGSPCVDAGDDSMVQAGWLDLDGQSRILGSHVDIGADESDGTTWPGPHVIRVAPQGNDANDGSSWPLAKQTIQAALNTAAAGDQIWVAAGTYVEHVTVNAGVALYGGFAGGETDPGQRNWTTNVTALDGNKTGIVITVAPGATLNMRIDGFTIRNGNCGISSRGSLSLTIANNTITGNLGSGISCDASSPVIRGNTISGNDPGIYCDASSSATITNNNISHNSAGGLSAGWAPGVQCDGPATIANNTITFNRAYGEGAVGNGGGIYCTAAATITGNTITDNGLTSGNYGPSGLGGGIYCAGTATIAGNTIARNFSGSGGGVYCAASATVSNNVVTGNSAKSWGGGIYCSSSGPTTIANNTIAGNSSGPGFGPSGGGGIYCGSATITNNVITGNSAGGYSQGGGISCGSATIANNVIIGNSAYESIADGFYGGGGIAGGSAIVNTIIAFNSSGVVAASSAIRYCCVYGNIAFNFSGTDPTGTNGNISADSLFVQTPAPGPDGKWGTADDIPGDVHLQAGSPCINAGDPAFVPTPGQMDLAGLPRVLYGRVDIGAYEYRLAGDINLDGYVNVADLAALVTAWAGRAGPPASSNWNASADLNSDGYVNVGDLQILVANWGRPG